MPNKKLFKGENILEKLLKKTYSLINMDVSEKELKEIAQIYKSVIKKMEAESDVLNYIKMNNPSEDEV